MSGHGLHELLRESKAATDIAIDEQTHRSGVTLSGGLHYEAELHTVEVGSTVYLRGARTIRREASPP
jgi:hypothetical protein